MPSGDARMQETERSVGARWACGKLLTVCAVQADRSPARCRQVDKRALALQAFSFSEEIEMLT